MTLPRTLPAHLAGPAIPVVAPPDPTITPTIEQIAEALGEPFAHLAPQQIDNPSGGPPLLWWALCTERGLVARAEWQPDTEHCIAGPTRDEALRAAWAYIHPPPASVPDLEPTE